jgi:hypothetical protein
LSLPSIQLKVININKRTKRQLPRSVHGNCLLNYKFKNSV